MNKNIEFKLLKEIAELKQKINNLEGINKNNKPIYQYSKISANILKKLVNIERKLDKNIFKSWFEYSEEINKETLLLFKTLIDENELLIETYNEEDLKVNFLIPILNKVHFKSFENECRDFYELPMKYETDDFIFNGTTDFVVSKGLIESKQPYFFIQEFKKGQQDGYPESQLLAELISAVELNKWKEIKGAYIVASLWYFVILQKIDKNKYQYFVSKKFDSMRLEDLKLIYKNLLFIKNNIIKG